MKVKKLIFSSMLLFSQVVSAKSVIVKEGGRIYTKTIGLDTESLKISGEKKDPVKSLPIGMWMSLQPNHFQLIPSEPNLPLLQFQCGLEDARIKVVKTLTGEVVLRTDSKVKLNFQNAYAVDANIFTKEIGKKRLELLNYFWLACRNAAVEYQSELDALIRKVTPSLNRESSYGYVRMPQAERIARVFSIPKQELFEKWQLKLCKQHELLSTNIPKEWNWKTKACQLQ